MAVSFNKPNVTNARPTPPVAARPATAANPFANIPDRGPRDPLPETGNYRLKLTQFERGYNPGTRRESIKVHVEIAEVFSQSEGAPHAVGDSLLILLFFTDAGLATLKQMVRCASKIATNEDYNAFDPDGEFINALFGASNDYSKRGDTVVGDLVDVRVMHGKPTDDGGYFRDYQWSIVQ
jgi:hypothetical protein